MPNVARVAGALVVALAFCGCSEKPTERDHLKPGVLDDGSATLGQATPSISHVAPPIWSGPDDPRKDGWDSEVLSAHAGQQLHALEKLLATPKLINEAQILRLATADCTSSSLIPGHLKTVFKDPVIHVQRSNQSTVPTSAEIRGPAGLVAELRALADRFSEASDLRFKFKIYQIQVTSESFTTHQLASFRGRLGSETIEQHATWEICWENELRDSTPRIQSIHVADFEQTIFSARGPTLFSDCTQAVLGQNTSFHRQLSYGLNHWVDRMQDLQYGFLLGTPGIALGDVNGDGLDDLYLCQEEGLPNRLFVQHSDGTLHDESESAGVNWLEGSRGVLILDFDNDGDQDLAVGIVGGIILASNDGQGRFTTRVMLPTSDDTMSLSAADYDGDGRLDIYVCGYFRNTRDDDTRSRSIGTAGAGFVYHDANNGAANSLFRNEIANNQWEFTDVTEQVGLDTNNRRWSLAAAWEDYDNDGDQDLYVANDFGINNLFRNDDGDFVDVATQLGAEDRASGMGIAWGDYNRDGWFDIYVGNMFSAAGSRIVPQREFKPGVTNDLRQKLAGFARGNTLLKNQNGEFEDVSRKSATSMGRWAWGTQFLDINNDGWDDLVVANGYVTGNDSGDL